MNKEKREYYVLAGVDGLKEKIIEAGLELSPVYLMTVKEDSDLGRRIKKEAKLRLSDTSHEISEPENKSSSELESEESE